MVSNAPPHTFPSLSASKVSDPLLSAPLAAPPPPISLQVRRCGIAVKDWPMELLEDGRCPRPSNEVTGLVDACNDPWLNTRCGADWAASSLPQCNAAAAVEAATDADDEKEVQRRRSVRQEL